MKNAISIFNFSVGKQTAETLDISIDGDIVDSQTEQFYRDWVGDDTTTSFKTFRDQCNKAVNSGVTTINGTINSGGGLITEAMAMHDYIEDLQSRNITVNMVGTGIVASASTYILMASKKSTLTKNSFFMIHDCSGFAYGSVSEVESQTATLRKFNDKVRDFYAEKTGLPAKEISAMMSKETWLTADDAKAKGFVTTVTNEQVFTNKIEPEKWLFNNTSVLAAYNSFTKKSPEMDITKITEAIESGFQNMIAKLGIKAGAENSTTALAELSAGIVNAIKESAAAPVDNTEVINSAVQAAMAAGFENFAKEIPQSFKDLVSTATKNAVSVEDLKKVSDDLESTKRQIANRTAGGGAGEQAINEKPGIFEHAGAGWADDSDD